MRRINQSIFMIINIVLTLACSNRIIADELKGKCLLEVGGEKYLNGPCNIDPGLDGGLVSNGNFSIGTGSSPSKYFAYVNKDAENKVVGYWNGISGGSHAHFSLGSLKQEGDSCWVNSTAKVCAWVDYQKTIQSSKLVLAANESDTTNCHSTDPDTMLAGCSAIIDATDVTNSRKLGDALDGRCLAYLKKEEYNLAIEDCSRAIQVRPDYIYPYNNLGAAYIKLSQHNEAIKYLNKALEMKRDFKAALKNRAKAYKAVGENSSAIRDYETYLSLKPDDQEAVNELASLKGSSNNSHSQSAPSDAADNQSINDKRSNGEKSSGPAPKDWLMSIVRGIHASSITENIANSLFLFIFFIIVIAPVIFFFIIFSKSSYKDLLGRQNNVRIEQEFISSKAIESASAESQSFDSNLDERIISLERLMKIRDSGILSDSEFDSEKKRIMESLQ